MGKGRESKWLFDPVMYKLLGSDDLSQRERVNLVKSALKDLPYSEFIILAQAISEIAQEAQSLTQKT
jgi:hypothetical protein